ncbi:hypothetical protein [Pseudoxanthomonas wuyuanensis]
MKPQEPLTAEERALAEQLARLGPHGEPSPALDARILAAAHAEISRPSATPKPRWPVAFGLAASALLAVGVAWQLRPVDDAPTVTEAPVATKMQTAESISETEDSSSPALAQQPDAGTPTDVAPSALHENLPAAPAKPLPATPKAEARRAPAKPRNAGTASPPPTAGKSAPAAVSAPRQLQSAPRPAPPAPVADRAEAETVPLPLPPPAPAPASAPASQARAAFAGEPASEREVSGYVIRSENDSYRTRSAAADATAQRARRQEQRALADEGQALDKVTATSSRLQRTDLQVPVHDDARLAPDEWLERIRLRRDLGDGASAAASLRLYVQEHPFRKVPEDLRPLLAE